MPPPPAHPFQSLNAAASGHMSPDSLRLPQLPQPQMGTGASAFLGQRRGGFLLWGLQNRRRQALQVEAVLGAMGRGEGSLGTPCPAPVSLTHPSSHLPGSQTQIRPGFGEDSRAQQSSRKARGGQAPKGALTVPGVTGLGGTAWLGAGITVPSGPGIKTISVMLQLVTPEH